MGTETLPVLTTVIRLILAALLGAFVGIERERHGSSAGFRTHILVCVGSAMTSLISIYTLSAFGYNDNVFRISAQVISGIGFLGAGTILRKDNGVISGLTTAAGMWLTASIGIACGYGYYIGAIIACAICVITTSVFALLEKNSFKYLFYVEANENDVQSVIELIEAEKLTVSLISAKSGIAGRIGLEFSTKKKAISDKVYDVILTSQKAEIVTKTIKK